jgi:hemerythrin-like metal-binding protein
MSVRRGTPFALARDFPFPRSPHGPRRETLLAAASLRAAVVTKVSTQYADKYDMFEWNDKYAIGVASIDTQHKGLYAIGAELYSAMSAGQARERMSSILARLVQYTENHFAFEERLMQQHHYPDFAAHKAVHDALIKKIAEFRADVVMGKIGIGIPLLKFVEEWLTDHIGKTDRKYVPCVTAKAA